MKNAYFSKEVNLESREEMIEFLRKHFRYFTMNSWNKTTSYAHRVKIHSLGLTTSQGHVAYDLLDVEGGMDEINQMLWEWGQERSFAWQIGFNGRSGGYLVLYQGGIKDRRVFTTPGKQIYYPEDEVDEGLEEVSTETIRERVELVQDFDAICDSVRARFVEICDTHTVETQVISVPKEVKVLVQRSN